MEIEQMAYGVKREYMVKYEYKGPVPEDKTDTNFPQKKEIMSYVNGVVRPGGSIFDYGSGRYARNATGLRDMGYLVYAYDPYKGTEDSGWEGVSNKLPSELTYGGFDLVFTSYVLNVVKEDVEGNILMDCRRFGRDVHWTRGNDIFTMAKKAIGSESGKVFDFFMRNFVPVHPTAGSEYADKNVSNETLMDFCRHGFETSRGFQRIPSPAGYEGSGNSVLFFRRS